MTAAKLRELHVPRRPLVLPNAWDADSARLVVAAGFPVVATSSAAVAESLGYADGQGAPAAEMLAAAARMVRVVDVPVTVDAESGYGLGPAELAGRLLKIGVVGCNLEDTEPGCGVRSLGEQVELLGAVREAAGAELVINARVDAFLGVEDEKAVLDEAVERARAYLGAGVDCVYPIHVRSAEVLREFVAAVSPAAVNATLWPGGPQRAELAELGVARISLGAGLWRASRAWLVDRLAEIG